MQRRTLRADAPIDVAPPTKAATETLTGISVTGLIGSALGFGVMIALAIAVGLGAGNASRLNAIPLAALSTIFAWGILFSVRPFPSRQSLLKGVVVASLIMVVVGAVLFGPELPVVLTPAIALIAQGAGLILQGSRKR